MEGGYTFCKEQDIVHKNIKPVPQVTSDTAAIFPKTFTLSVPNLQAQFSLPTLVDWDTGLPSAG